MVRFTTALLSLKQDILASGFMLQNSEGNCQNQTLLSKKKLFYIIDHIKYTDMNFF